MMGPKKLSTIRAELREAFGKTDHEIVAWFDRQIKELERLPKARASEIETLLSIRDALLRETKRKPVRKPRPQARPRSKS